MRPFKLLQDAFQGITRRPIPNEEELDSLPWEIQLIYHTLVAELHFPVRIIFGYDGFKKTSSLRDSFVSFLMNQKGKTSAQTLCIPSFPSLICCGEHCLVKCNGMPFNAPLYKDGFWPVFGSTTWNPIELLLQFIWTRLVYGEKLSASVFDDDNSLQRIVPLIEACPKTKSCAKKVTWQYRIRKIPSHIVDATQSEPLEWSPVFLDVAQFSVVQRLCEERQIDVNEEGFTTFLTDADYTVDSLISSLNDAGLVARKGNNIVLLTRCCQCAILPDRRLVAAENISGQLTRWLQSSIDRYSRDSTTSEQYN